MNKNRYKYLFPFEKVPIHSRIIIYGAGTLGQDYLQQMQLTHYCEVIALADKNYEHYPPMIVPIISPEKIHEYAVDYVVMALRMAAAYNEVKRILKQEGIEEEKIICIFERRELPNLIFKDELLVTDLEKFAFLKTDMSIAILATGGFGDMVIQKRFIMELIRLVPKCIIDFYNIKAMYFLKYLYADCKNVNQVIPDLGSRYKENHKKYSLALTIEACHFINVDWWKKTNYEMKENNLYQDFIRSIDKLRIETKTENVDISTPAHLTLIRRLYRGLNAYTGFNYNGAFAIKDKKVGIPLEREWEPLFQNLGLGRYITVNFGNGDCADGRKIAKSWSKDKFEKFISIFKANYPEIEVLQLGAENSEKLMGIDRYILGVDFRLSVHLLKNTMVHVDIEGGLVHIATQLGTKCVVLFGPTVKEYYGYEQNINIQAGKCHNCWGIYSDVNMCARGMEEPECMYSITPVMVMDCIKEYMSTILNREEPSYDK